MNQSYSGNRIKAQIKNLDAKIIAGIIDSDDYAREASRILRQIPSTKPLVRIWYSNRFLLPVSV